MLLTIFYQFFMLGCTSFGGPAAHIGYFRRHFVEHQKWVSASRYANMITLSQILPGPGSSQVGFAIGMEKAGWLGGLAAFIGFTLPSFLIMLLLAFSASQSSDWSTGIISGLKLFAVVIVADAVISMARSFCKTWPLRIISSVVALYLFTLPTLSSQLIALIGALIVGLFAPLSTIPKTPDAEKSSLPWPVLSLIVILFVVCFSLIPDSIFAPFYQAGSLVFGGGHVVLPLLQANLPTVTNEVFLTAYAAAQAVPGPMFTIATYLGALWDGTPNITNALIATLAIFTPGLLLMGAFLNRWQALQAIARFAHISAALNAAVVGLLFAAWLNPIIPSAVSELWHWAIIGVGYGVLTKLKPPIWVMLIAFAAIGLIAH
ncbi:Chromate transport protein ChrA [Pseudoalteromonas luteoviolacea B = ATCC 29581]|nr:Chromate transport protein ChrA [Pseudoalteromonas luteoviolacea B = ATCC 29581]